MKKNDIFEAECIGYDSNGFGVVRFENMVFFVKGLLKNEIAILKAIKILKNYGYAKIEKIIEQSKERRTPNCEVFGICGGCDLMHLDYEEELYIKREKIKNAMRKIAEIDIDEIKILPSPQIQRYRNKVQIPVHFSNRIYAGFYRKKTNEIIEFSDCLMQTELSNKIFESISEKIKTETAKELRHIIIRHAYFNNEAMVVFVIRRNVNIDYLIDSLVSKFPEIKSILLNFNDRKDNVILGEKEKLIFGRDYIIEKIGNLKFRISSKSFFQINSFQTANLYNKAIENLNLSKDDVVIDLYCGTGSISLFAAKKVRKVFGVEIVKDAIFDAKENMKLNDIENVEFINADASHGVKKLLERKIKANALIVDPPRQGLDKSTIEAILKLDPPKIAYISCNVATLARDLKELNQNGYKLDYIEGVDMFPRTGHVETVVLMSRK
ncbi:MAG: 23S rRNA (uracil(1939)-C(5))-methyltransferase RlmD [Clostridia bacterium]|nr:23S rRNA (uracil(1939)-C(5))-methyltransferase RlmD [Clostridia bacterium]